MNTMAKTLSDQEIADLAQWYAGIEVTATVPPQ
jgi:cytochrome c553